MPMSIFVKRLKKKNYVNVVRRYAALVDPDTGDKILYEYPAIKYKDGATYTMEDEARCRAFRLAASEYVKKDGLIDENADLKFYADWDDVCDDPDYEPYYDNNYKLDEAMERLCYYEGILRSKYWETKRNKNDEIMSDAEVEKLISKYEKRIINFGE